MAQTPEELEFKLRLSEAEQAETDNFATTAPIGEFSASALNSLTKAVNALQPLFSDPETGFFVEDYPAFDVDQTALPGEFMRLLSAVKQAVDDAVAQDIVSPELQFSLDVLKSDADLAQLAGRFTMLAKDKDFKRWLKEAPPAPTEDQVQDAVDEEVSTALVPAEDEIAALFASRS